MGCSVNFLKRGEFYRGVVYVDIKADTRTRSLDYSSYGG